MTTTPENAKDGLAGTVPPGSRFDPVTGADLHGSGGGERREAFALQPGEPVMSFNLVTSMMPLASGSAPQTYRWALGVGLLIPVIAGALGFLAFAFVAAALVVPAIYIVYMYDVNEWEDQPLLVVLGAVGLAAALGVGWTFAWHAGILGGELAPVDLGEGSSGIRWTSMVVLVLLVPIVSLILQQVGPLFLATRPQFDDMIDGLTFGVAAGASFAAAETIVVNRGLFSSFGSVDSPNAGFWVSLILTAAIVKPIVYGAACGIAVAAFSGLGEGYEGFKPAYFRGLGEALLALIVFQGGLFFASRQEGTTGAVIGLVWGALVAVVLLVRLRYLLHFAVLEAALEASAGGTGLKDTARGTAFCPSCEMPLLEGANFCAACGTTTRSGNKTARARNRTPDEELDGTGKPTLAPTPAGAAPRDNKKTALVVGSVVGTLLIAGVVGQAAAAAAADEPAVTPVEIEPQIGSGPETEEPPEPADAPGPEPDPSESTEGGPVLGSTGSGTSAAGMFDLATLSGSDPTADPTDGRAGTADGSFVEVGNGIGFELSPNFVVEKQKDGSVQVYSDDGGYFWVNLTPPPTDINTMIITNLDYLQKIGIQELAISNPEAVQLPTSSVVSAARLYSEGLLANGQGGAVPVGGFSFYFLLQDGSGVTAFGVYAKQAVSGPDDPLAVGYDAMLASLVETL